MSKKFVMKKCESCGKMFKHGYHGAYIKGKYTCDRCSGCKRDESGNINFGLLDGITVEEFMSNKDV